MKKISIYSLSTVGVRQHFHQDYLLHEDRTDFTGSNGSGKSIIADLFQIIFIANKKFIKFGTDGLDNEKRQIHSLPYKQNEAYAFFNVRVNDNQYITIGVYISSKVGVPIKPFVITVNSDLNLNLEENSFSQPLKFKDFLNESGRVLNLKELAKQLNAKKKLKLMHFTNAENLDAYYAFLYQKEILPINLAIPEHLKSFATVIQSFSRASNLRLKNSKDLKNFLFEPEEENLLGEFEKYKTDLLKLLRDFKKLKENMDNVGSKQIALTNLKDKLDVFVDIQFEFSQMEVLFHRHHFNQAQKNLDEISSKITKLEKLQASFNKSINKLAENVESWEEKKKFNEQRIDSLNELITLNKELQPIVDEISFWQEVEFPEISQVDENLVKGFQATSRLRLEEIKSTFEGAIELLEDYETLEKVDSLRNKQREKLEKLKGKLSKENKQNQNLLNILDSTDEDSLLQRVLKSGKGLSEKQEIVFSSILGLGFRKPSNPSSGDRFLNDQSILDEQFITQEEQNDGAWLKVGNMSEFFKRKYNERMFNNPNTFGQDISQLKEQISKDIKTNGEILAQIDKIQNGEHFNEQLFDDHYDLRLTDNSQINGLKLAITLILTRKDRIDVLQKANQEKIKRQQSLLNLLKLKKSDIHDNLQKQAIEKGKEIDREWKKYSDQLSQKTKDLAVIETQIDNLLDMQQQTQPTFNQLKENYQNARDKYTKDYPDFDLNTIESKVFKRDEYDRISSEKDSTQKAYRDQYIEVANSFEETKNKGDVNIALQIESNTFDFSSLESTLLGPKIKHLDKIKPEMDEMNRTRLEFVDNLYEKMIKIFTKTQEQYKRFDDKVKDLNDFFKDRKISEQYYFSIDFTTEKCLDINWIYELNNKSVEVFKKGELPFGKSADEFIEEFFQKLSRQRQKVSLTELLNPKSYFHLSTKMEDEDGDENSGSTGETYTALVLLGIARLSLVQDKNRGGLRFVILEESANLDDTNFNIFPKIAKEYNYQIITMTPKPFGSDSTDGWYLHQLIKSKDDKNLNYPIPASYFKTKNARQKLSAFINEEVL